MTDASFGLSYHAAVIPNGTALSQAVALLNGRLIAVFFPNSWTAANISFRTGLFEAELGDLYDEGGNEVVITGGSGRRVGIQVPAPFAGCPILQVRSGTQGAPVNQAAERTVLLICQKLYRE